MSVDWQRALVRDLAQQRAERVHPQRDDETPYVALEHIPNGGGRLLGAAVAGVATSHKTRFRAGDTLFGKLRPNLRKVVRADFDGVCSTDIIAVGPKSGNDPAFLYQLLASSVVYRHVMGDITGTKMPRTSWKRLADLSIRVPPLPEQRAIAAVLDAIDDTIERTEAVIAATEELRRALLHELLTRGVPGQHSEWRDVPGVGRVPACWEVVRLGDVAEVNSSNWDPAESSRILYLDLTAIASPGRLSLPRELAATEAPSRARRRVRSGDILVSTVRPNLRGFARVTYAPNNLIASTGFAVISPLPAVDRSFLYHHVMARWFSSFLENASTGQAYPAVRPSDVAGYPLPLPTLPEQRSIAAMLSSVDDAAERGREEQEQLQPLKTSAAEALLTGRVRVRIRT